MSSSSANEIEMSKIEAAVYRLSGAFYNMEDVGIFLSSTDLNKDNTRRFICWLSSFGIISPNHEMWARELFELYTKYRSFLRTLIKDPMNPLLEVPQRSASIIESDIMRGMAWFHGIAADLKISEFYINDAELRANRILAVYSRESRTYSYTQGHDRYVFICYVLSLDFSSQSGLTTDFAEALAFFLAKNFIKMTEISKYLDNVAETEEHFEIMDGEMCKFSPEIMHQLFNVGQSSIHFALRWELLLFADEYDIKRLLFLWDQILYYKNIFKKFLFALCIAHIQQITPALPGEVMVEKIQNFRNWNVQRILDDSLKYLKHNEMTSQHKSLNYFVGILCFIVFFIYVLYLFFQNY